MVETTVDRGSTFTVRLPAIRVPARATPPAEPAVPPVRPTRILVVDDNADAARTLAELLRGAGHDVVVALDGPRSAVRLIAVTGYGTESDRTRTREAGFERHFVKPLDPTALLAALARTDLTPSAGGARAPRCP